jgi:hypothetical protein
MKKYIYGFASVGFIVLAVVAFVFWEFYLADRINTVPVYVATTTIEPDTAIPENAIKQERRNYKNLPPNYIQDPSEIVGKKSLSYIDSNDVITKGKLNVTLEEAGKSIFPIPSQWIEGIPGSIKRGDKVNVYLTFAKGTKVTATTDGSATVTTSEGKTAEAKVQAKTTITVGDQTVNPDKPVIENCRVVYVRDSNNKSVVISNGTPEDRQDLSGNPNKMELLLTQDEFIKVKKAMESGYKLVFSY